MEAFLNFLIFPKILALSQGLALVQNQLEKLGEVYTINFLIVMYDLKLRIKTGTLKNRYNRISERSLVVYKKGLHKHHSEEAVSSGSSLFVISTCIL